MIRANTREKGFTLVELMVAITIATVNDPTAAAKKRSSVNGEVLAKREPVTAPMPTTAALATHQGSTA